MINISQSTSTRPYLVRALHEWCTDNGFTPYVAVLVDETVQVPREYVNNGEIVLNVSFDATSGMQLSNEFIQFKARFGGVAREIVVPMGRVIAIYAKENGQGMAFPAPAPTPTGTAVDAAAASDSPPEPPAGRPAPTPAGAAVDAAAASDSPPEPPAGSPSNSTRPQLKRVK
ncbi:MAG: ClpXP protease specificity-enhancing factor [Burkholderiales bacterium]|nr:ClpXP protease specificity-enhancing factor [Burkholderiales bacterium]